MNTTLNLISAFAIVDPLNGPTPLWQQLLMTILLLLLGLFAALSLIWRNRERRGQHPTGTAFLAGFAILVFYVIAGCLIMYVPFLFFPYHDFIGVGWFFAAPVVLAIVVIAGILARRRSGAALSISAAIGIVVWALVIFTVKI